MNIKDFIDFKKKGILPLAFAGAAFVCALVALIMYVTTGVTHFTAHNLNQAVTAMLIVGMILNVATAVFDFKVAKYVCFIMYLIAFCEFIVFEVDYISNVFVSIDGTSFSAEFIVTLLFMILDCVFVLVSAAFTKDPLESKFKEVQ